MKEKLITVSNKMGLHARPASSLVQIATRFAAEIKIYKDDYEVNAKSILGVMTLAAAHGTVLRFTADGDDAEQALSAIEKLFNAGFEE